MVLAKKYRLYKKDDFRRMYHKSSRRVSWKYGVVMYRKNNAPQSCFAFVVSVKVSKKSAVRNLLKRRTSEWIRKNLGRIRAGYDMAFVFSKNAAEAKPAIFFQDLEAFFQSIRMIL
ncbi:ribonuclease P protein component [Patescibacteria group bacterium]|nr:ribonuclease P protein component [Patescibacteria group bacterium]